MVRIVPPRNVPVAGLDPSPREKNAALLAQSATPSRLAEILNGAAMTPGQPRPGVLEALMRSPAPETVGSTPGVLQGIVRATSAPAPGQPGAYAPAPVSAPAPAPSAMMSPEARPAALDTTPIAPDVSQMKPRGGTDWGRIAGIAGDVLSGFAGFPPLYALAQQRKRKEQDQAKLWAREDAQRSQDHQWKLDEAEATANRPQYFTVGRDRVSLDPRTGQTNVVYDGPEDYQTYASTLGLNPDDDGYEDAVKDYVLRGNGPTSAAARQALAASRNAARLAAKAAPTYRDLHPSPGRSRGASGPPRSTNAVVAPILSKLAQGGKLTPGEQQALAYGRGGGGGRSALPIVSSPADAAKLPSGTRFKTPDGRMKVVP